jgi:hypothetical protein
MREFASLVRQLDSHLQSVMEARLYSRMLQGVSWLSLWESPNRRLVQLMLESRAPEGSFAAITASSARMAKHCQHALCVVAHQ